MSDQLKRKEENMSELIDCTVEGYRKAIKVTKCEHCGYEGLNELSIEMYPHDYGWPVVEEPKQKQWLYVTCPECDCEWALWKLGVPRQKTI